MESTYSSGSGIRSIGGAFGSVFSFLLNIDSLFGFFFFGLSPSASVSSSSSTAANW